MPDVRESVQAEKGSGAGTIPGPQDSLRRHVVILWAMLGVTVLLSLTVTAPLWRVLPLPALLAYPWQLLGPAGLLLALLAGAAVRSLTSRAGVPPLAMLAVMLAAIVLGSYTYLAPRFVAAADLPDLSHPALAQLDSQFALLDARFDEQVAPGQPLHLTLIWQALSRPDADYTTFAQLVDAQGRKVGQQDARPHDGSLPTNTWIRGDIVRDNLTIPVAADAAPGTYNVDLGMYLLSTMQRLRVAGTDQNAIVLGPVTVK